MTRRVLFCWELGHGKGDVLPYLALFDRFAADGFEVSVAVNDTAEVGVEILARGHALLQAPVCNRVFSGLPGDPYTFTEVLIQFGYAHVPVLRGLVGAWCTMMQRESPSLVICNNAPTAALVAGRMGIPVARVGSGFECPPATTPSALLRDYQPGVTERIARSDKLLLSAVNTTLRLAGWRELERIEELYRCDETLLMTIPGLDHFPTREGEPYHGVLASDPAGAAGPQLETDCEIFVQVKAGRNFDELMASLRKFERRTLVQWSCSSVADRARIESDSLRCTDELLDVTAVLERCKLVICNASHTMTAEALRAGKPLLLLPGRQEQLLLSRRVCELGAALMVEPGVRYPKFPGILRKLLEEPCYQAAASEFSRTHANLTQERTLQDAFERCCAIAL